METFMKPEASCGFTTLVKNHHDTWAKEILLSITVRRISVRTLMHTFSVYMFETVLRNRAILPRFRFRFRVPNFSSTVPAPVPVPVPTPKF